MKLLLGNEMEDHEKWPDKLGTRENLLKTFSQTNWLYKCCSSLADTRSREGALGLPVHHGYSGPSRIALYTRLPSTPESPILNGASNGSAVAAFFGEIISQSQ